MADAREIPNPLLKPQVDLTELRSMQQAPEGHGLPYILDNYMHSTMRVRVMVTRHHTTPASRPQGHTTFFSSPQIGTCLHL
jgi:hypothetical protein